MDQQLEESLNLDGSMGVEFDHNDEVIVGQSDIILGDGDENSATLTPITCMELEHLKDHQIMMKSDQDIMGGNYTLQHLAVSDMPVIGGEEEVLAEVAEDDLVKEIIVKSELSTGDFEISIGSDVTSDCGLPEMTEEQEIVSSDSVVPIPLQAQINLALQNSRSAKSNLRQVAIAPKPHTVKFGQSKFTSLSANKQWTIAPKPVTMLPAKTSVVKKIAIGNVSRSSNVNLGSFGPGKQLVLLPSSSSGGQTQRLKLVQNTGSSSVQYIKTEGQILQPQVVTAKRISPSVGQKQVMTKVIVQGGSTDNQASGSQPVLAKLLSSSTGLSGSPRYISLQQAQQMGLISGHTAAKMVAVSPTKAGNQSVRLGRPKQPVLTVKPPAKILPAPPQGIPKKIVIQQTPQSVVLSPASGKPSQVVRETVPQVTGVYTNIAPAQPINARQMKGVQYVRVVPASSVSSCGAITPKSPVKAVNTTPTPIAPRPSTTSGASSGRTLLTLPGGKTLLLADGQGTLLQMVSDKVSPPPLAVLSNNSSALNKLSSKPQQKLVRIAPVVQKVSQASSGASSYSLNRSVLSMSADTAELEQSMDQEMSPEDTKPSLQSLIAEMVSDDNDIIDEVDNSNAVESEDPEDESMEAEEEDTIERIKMQDSHEHSDMAENQRIVMYPASYDNAKSIGRVVEIKQEELAQYQMHKATSGQPVDNSSVELGLRPRKPCNCTKSQCLKLYCDCFANGEFCNQCNCNNCYNNLENEEERQKAIKSCLERNPNAFRPKIGKAKSAIGPEAVRRHNKGCNCKRSGCLKNYCECYEAKIACSANCKCVGCRNVEETVERGRRRDDDVLPVPTSLLNSRDHHTPFRQSAISHSKEPYSFMTGDVIDAVCQCLLAAAVEGGGSGAQATVAPAAPTDPVQLVLEEFARCLQDIIGAARQAQRPPAESVL